MEEYREHNPECKICEYKNRCAAGCRGNTVLHNGGTDLLGIDPEACLFFKGGYYDRVKQLIRELSPSKENSEKAEDDEITRQ